MGLTQRVRPRSRRGVTAMLVGVIGLGSGVYWWQESPGSSPSSASSESANGSTAAMTADTQALKDQQWSRTLVGEWVLERNGRRELVVRADGTATMNVTVESWHRLLFGERLRFEADWKIEDGVLSFTTTGGEPEAGIKAVTKMYGETRKHPIVDINADQAVLKDPDEGEEDHVYNRVR